MPTSSSASVGDLPCTPTMLLLWYLEHSSDIIQNSYFFTVI